MSKIALSPNASGTGTFTLAAPNSNTDRTLTLPDAAGTIALLGSTGFSSIQVFTSDGTWTKPSGVSKVKVIVIGGGGGSGGTSSTLGRGGGGGGGGGTAIKVIDVSSVSTVSVTVGGGGTAGASTPTDGGTGGTSSFGAYCSATGGGGGSRDGSSGAGGGTGGSGSGGDINIPGGTGSPGPFSTSVQGTGIGGNSSLSGINGRFQADADAVTGLFPGGGAMASRALTISQARAGAAGGAGVVIVEEYK